MIRLRFALSCSVITERSKALFPRLRFGNVNVNQNFSVAKIAELLRSPQRSSRVTVQNQEMIVEK